MSDSTILAIDQGTTSSRAILFSESGDILHSAQKELTLHYPHKGWVEQDALDIWNDTKDMAQQVIDKQKQSPLAIGITNQRETTILWDKKTGVPVYNAIVWQDRRTAEYCASLKEQGHEDMVRERTGLLLDPYFSATKIAWILDNVEGLRVRAEAGEIAFGTVDTWLVWHLTGGAEHVTDITNASRTMIYNIQTQQWDDELLALFNIPEAILPTVKDNVAHFGTTAKGVLNRELQIGGIAGDQHAALIGQACFKEGMIKSTYGTGCFALMNIGRTYKQSQNKLLTTVAYRINGEICYALEGSIFVAGAAIQWLRDNLGLFSDAKDSESMAISVPDNNGVYFVPAFTGLGAPYWNPHAEALICGLTRESNKNHIVRAALEAQAYQTLDLIDAMKSDSGHDINIIRADGGLVANKFVCQHIADILDTALEVPKVTETTAQGAAYLAGLSVGLYENMDDVAQKWQKNSQYEASMTGDERNKLVEGWQSAIRKTLS